MMVHGHEAIKIHFIADAPIHEHFLDVSISEQILPSLMDLQ